MAVDADRLQVRQRRGGAVGRQRVVKGDPEFVGLQTGGDVRVGLGVDVRVHAQRNARHLADRACHLVQAVQLGNRFDVEAQDAVLEREAHFIGALAHARKNHLVRIAAGSDHAQQFTARDDVETGAFARQQVQDGQVGIGLHRVADQRVAPGAGVGKGVEVLQQRGLGIDIGRGAELFGDAGQGRAFGVQHAVQVKEVRHDLLSRGSGKGRWRRWRARLRRSFGRRLGHVQRTWLAACGQQQSG